MVQSSKRLLVSLYERTHTILYLRWQSLRRNNDYKNDVQECLSNLQALYEQWVTQQQTRDPHPALSQNVSALAIEVDEIWRRDRARLP